jgi:hypothetical protein
LQGLFVEELTLIVGVYQQGFVCKALDLFIERKIPVTVYKVKRQEKYREQ